MFRTSMIEAEAAYLQRHGLLLAGEARQLGPRDYEPGALAGWNRLAAWERHVWCTEPAQLAAIYNVDDAVWRDLTATATAAVRKADAQIAARCRELGICPEKWLTKR